MPNLRIRRRSMGPSTIREAQQLIARIRENGLEIYMEDFERRARPIEAYETPLKELYLLQNLLSKIGKRLKRRRKDSSKTASRYRLENFHVLYVLLLHS